MFNLSSFTIQTLALWGIAATLQSYTSTNTHLQFFSIAQENENDLAEAGLSPEDAATISLIKACVGSSEEDDVEAVRLAISNGADVNASDERGKQAPFMAAVLRGKINIVTYLLQNHKELKIDLYKGERSNYIPVDGAAFQGRVEVMKLLLEHTDMDPSYFHEDGYAPFHRACWGPKDSHTEVVKLLLEHGVDVNLKGGNRTCYEMAEKNKRTMFYLYLFNEHNGDTEIIREKEKEVLDMFGEEGIPDDVNLIPLATSELSALFDEKRKELKIEAASDEKRDEL